MLRVCRPENDAASVLLSKANARRIRISFPIENWEAFAASGLLRSRTLGRAVGEPTGSLREFSEANPAHRGAQKKQGVICATIDKSGRASRYLQVSSEVHRFVEKIVLLHLLFLSRAGEVESRTKNLPLPRDEQRLSQDDRLSDWCHGKIDTAPLAIGGEQSVPESEWDQQHTAAWRSLSEPMRQCLCYNRR